MTDKEKLDKLVAEIERLYHQSLVDENRQAEWGLSSAACTSYGKSKACKELLSFTDSMQKEPKECMFTKDYYTDEDRKVLCDGCKEECKYVSNIPPVFDEGYWERLGEKPANDDLEGEINRYLSTWSTSKDNGIVFCEKMARHFAAWQKQQMERYRIEHCMSLTNEQAELEDNFVSSHVEKNNRIPTFIDAIEYGIEYGKQQMMKEAVDGKIYETLARSKMKACTKGYISHFDYRVGEKVKIIIIKED